MKITRHGVCILLSLTATLSAAEGTAPFTLSALGDCEKISKDGAVPESPHFWDAKAMKLRLNGGRNEMVAAQLMLAATQDVKQVNVEIGDLKGPQTIPANPHIQLFQEIYQYVAEGKWFYSVGNGWTWDKSKSLIDRKWYPEILVPFNDPYGSEHKPVGAPFDIKVANGPNQGVWIDLYIPADAKPGVYTAPIAITVAKQPAATATLELTVHDFTLPDEFHVDGYGEIYGMCYDFHHATYKEVGFDKWWPIAQRYHQMAHQHRFEISDREGRGPKFFVQPELYDKAYGPILDGTLFTKENGYVGPGANTGVSFWRAPFGEVNRCVPTKSDPNKYEFTPWTDAELSNYTAQAKQYWAHCVEKKWDKKRFFAYIIDEAMNDAVFRANQKKLCDALDAGAGPKHIDLMWTAHTNPRTLADDPALDLRGVIRWWSPNGEACDPGFLQERMKQGETAWFYHHAPPAIGLNIVNATGIDLRTWGAACWRYKLNGSFWWAMDYFETKEVMIKSRENRWGNGILFYPGARLPDLGLPAIDGPLSCLRMKAYRRGLQDYEYGWLLKQKGKEPIGDAAIKKIMPVALAEAMPGAMTEAEGRNSVIADAKGKTQQPATKIATPPWSTDVNDWYAMQEELAAELDKK
jgi:hypothetical protein